MAINPPRKTQPPPPVALDEQRKKELLARATGAAPEVKPTARPQLQTPPPAKPIVGITGNPPLPTGRVVSQTSAASLTDIERQTLESVGWREGDELPSSAEGMRLLQAEVRRISELEVPLPDAPPFTPPVPLAFHDLPEKKQTQLVSALAEIKAREEQSKQAAADQQRRTKNEAGISGMTTANAAVNQSIKAFEKKVEAAATYTSDDIAKERSSTPTPQAPPAAPLPAAAAPLPTTPTPQVPVSETGAASTTLSHCPHCEWDLAITDVPEPPYRDRLGFLQTVLGECNFSKEYELYGGQIVVTFRTLTMAELDVVYAQTYHDRGTGKISNELDYYETMNRYRLFLQLQTYRSRDGKVTHDLHDGYSRKTNPNGTSFWVDSDEVTLDPGATHLGDIEQYLMGTVLKTETVFRTVHNTCRHFNRLVAKMEAMVDNTDFWKPTEEPV